MVTETLALEDLADEIIETDLLIIGGGLAGCTAAIYAKENKNIDVTILEKGAIRRSGECGVGMDHYPAIAHPKINDFTAEEYGTIRTKDFHGLSSARLSILTAQDALKPIPMLEEIGVKIREEDGNYRLLPGRSQKGGDFILYRGADLKLRLAAEVHKRGVDVFDRTMCTNLLTKGGKVIGATAVNVRNGKFLVIKAKATLLSVGGVQRLYEYPFATFPNSLFMAYQVATNAAGAALAYRVGAKLINMEFTYVHIGLAGWPQAAHVRHATPITNSKGENLQEKYAEVAKKYGLGGFYPWTNFAYMPNMNEPEASREVLYHDATNTPDETETYGLFMSANETPMGVKIIRDRGGLRKAPFEMRDWIAGLARSFSGVVFNDQGETSVKGLFVAGDTQGGYPMYGATGALVWGYRIGKHLQQNLADEQQAEFDRDQISQVKTEKDRVQAPLGRKKGVDPLELEDYVRKLMDYYVQIYKVEPKLKRAIELMRVVKEEFMPHLVASNPHELMRALEVQNIIDIAEIHAKTALLRTETRMPPYHYRVDYPEQDDVNWNKNLVVEKAGEQMEHSLETIE